MCRRPTERIFFLVAHLNDSVDLEFVGQIAVVHVVPVLHIENRLACGDERILVRLSLSEFIPQNKQKWGM